MKTQLGLLAILTLALCPACASRGLPTVGEHDGASRDAKELEPGQRAVDFLVRAQRPSPAGEGAWGWRYQSRMEIEQKFAGGELDSNAKRELFDSDVSITGWAAAALFA